MSVARDAVERVRQPEYTGENRCLPCTATNLAIGAVGAVLLAFLWVPLAVGFAVLAVASVWLRGYLVPGTPELTKRYFPEWLLAKFDKAPAPEPITDDDLDPEATLVEAGVLQECETVDDLCLTDDFETTWREGMAGLTDEDTLRADLADHLDLDVADVSFDDYGDAFVARHDGANVGQWESRAALLADLSAAGELPDWVDDWPALTPRARSQLLGGLRIFVETCPVCGGVVTADEETVQSCCRSRTVVGVGCSDCGDRLLEVPLDDAAA
jgi:hypothetical protein